LMSARALDGLANVSTQGERLEIVLTPGGSVLSGTVLDGMGGEIPGALVTARFEASSPILGAARTDSDGHFMLNVPAERLELEASAEGYSRTGLAVLAP